MRLTAVYAALIFSSSVLVKSSMVTCALDNVLRALKNTALGTSASDYCSTYIRSTTTVSTTVTTTPVFTTFTTLPDALTTTSTTLVVTSTNTDYTTATTVITVDVSSLITYQSTPLAFSTPPTGQYAKRSLDANELSELATVPPSRISSACSCLVTAPTLTIFQTSTSTVSSIVTSGIGPLATDTLTFISTVTTSAEDLVTVTTPTTTLTTVDVTVATLPPAPTETVICGLLSGENAAAVHAVIFAQNGILFDDCLAGCKMDSSCAAIFWFGDVSQGVVTCRYISIPVAQALNYDLVGLPFSFYFSDRDCPFQSVPGY